MSMINEMHTHLAVQCFDDVSVECGRLVQNNIAVYANDAVNVFGHESNIVRHDDDGHLTL